MDNLVTQGAETLFSNGVLGVAVVGLVYFVMVLRAELRDVRAAHRVELAEKEKLILELYGRLVTQAAAGFKIANATQSTMSGLLDELRGSTKEREEDTKWR